MTTVFINEIHYNNFGIDVSEGVEIAGPAGTNLSNWTLHLYEGDHGKVYKVTKLQGLIPNQQNSFGALFFKTPDIKNGGSKHGDGIALVDAEGKVRQFLSYGSKDGLKAEDGPAAHQTSVRLPLEESSLSLWGESLQLKGQGNVYEDFKWTKGGKASFGKINKDQKFTAPKPVVVSAPAPTPAPTSTPTPAPQPTATTPSPSSSTSSDSLTVTIDSRTQENRAAHYTTKYRSQDLFVVRRGFPFVSTITANADLAVSDVSIVLSSYPETNRSMTLNLQDSEPSLVTPAWSAYLESPQAADKKNVVNVAVGIPADAIVGQYTVTYVVKGQRFQFPAGPVLVLFNAWSEKDTVYLADQAQREEYVLNENGLIWVGTQSNFTPRGWNFAQFEDNSVHAAIYLLEKLPRKERKDSVLVSRHLSAVCNAAYDGGVLVGNWSGNFEGGTKPTTWTGSGEILKQYNLTKQAVKYGQCWVFSGVVTAVCRSLGIPARSITNFASAHDTGFDRTIDKFYKRDSNEVDDSKTTDSIWNFHVWNDVWLTRPDLGTTLYDGWQAIDATPQELSEGTYQMGPASLNAVKNGTKDAKYDGEFVFSEVNADIKEYVENEDGNGYTVVNTVTNGVGKNISTKAVGKNEREDITLQYKYAEGTVEERAAYANGLEGGQNTGDVIFAVDAQSVTFDQPIEIKLTLSKRSADIPTRTVNVNVSANFIHYTGRLRQALKTFQQQVVLDGNDPKTVSFKVQPNEFQNSLNNNRTVAVRAFGSVVETKQVGLATKEFEFTEPAIKFSLKGSNNNNSNSNSSGSLKLNDGATVVVTFTNPLSIPLTRAVLGIEGQGLTKVQQFRFENVDAKATVTQEVQIKAKAVGKRLLIASFECDQLTDIEDHDEIIVVA